MKIGLLSDTHNNIEITLKAIEIFKSKGVDLIIHSGDISSPKMLNLFKGGKCRFVLGNVDLDVDLLNEEARELGFGPVEYTCDIKIGEKRILVMHGNDVPLFKKAVECGEYNYIIKGHTHSFENYFRNNSRIVNPGCLYGGTEQTIAVLDTENDSVEKIHVED
ncbi:MAG: YfcE family phosphodiesterase [Spirochaetes bacterium]|jgi:hypothetical protein|nr:YfcE family phosphodiesterase [Spirochaetota bacterium]